MADEVVSSDAIFSGEYNIMITALYYFILYFIILYSIIYIILYYNVIHNLKTYTIHGLKLTKLGKPVVVLAAILASIRP